METLMLLFLVESFPVNCSNEVLYERALARWKQAKRIRKTKSFGAMEH